MYEIPHYITHSDAAVHVQLQRCSKKESCLYLNAAGGKVDGSLKTKEFSASGSICAHPISWLPAFFTLKFILCANVTFEPEGDARTPAEH